MPVKSPNKSEKFNILYLDDEEENLMIFTGFYRHFYNVFTAIDLEDAKAIMAREDIQLVISDQRLRGIDTGVDFLNYCFENHPMAERILLTGFIETSTLMDALNECQVFQFVTKPWEESKLKLVMDNALNSHKLKKEKQELLGKLKDVNRTLEEKVKQRTEHISKLSSIKDKLISVIAHDLRGPVVNLDKLVDMIFNSSEKGFSEQELRMLSGDLRKSVSGIRDLLDNLLSWSRIRLRNVSVDMQPFKLVDIVLPSLGLYETMASQKGIKVSVSVSKEIVVITDRYILSLIFRNLIHNALKFTKKGGKVSISAKQEKGYVTVEVRDTGIGMSSEDIHRVFKEQEHFSSSGTEQEGGTRLGLKICIEYLQTAGSKLTVSSEQGKGSVFSFSLKSEQ